MARAKRICPECGSVSVVRIVYGYPGSELIRQAEAGKIWLGGCCVSGNDPEWHCKECGHEWGADR